MRSEYVRSGTRFDDPLLNRLIELGEAQDHAIQFGEYDSFERLHTELLKLHAEGQARSDFAAKLALLYEHANPQVRWIAAVWSYPDAPKAARDAMKRLAESEFSPQCAYAHFAADDMDNGRAPPLETSCRPPLDEFDPDIEAAHRELMEFSDFQSLDLAMLVDRIVKIGLAQDHAQDNSEFGKYNELFDRVREIGVEVNRRGRDAGEAVVRLYSHHNEIVRLNAVRCSHEVAPDAARACLEDIAKSKVSPYYVTAGELLGWIDKQPKRRH